MKNLQSMYVLLFAFIMVMPLQAQRIYQQSMLEFMQEFPEARYKQCTNQYEFNHAPFPLYQEFSQSYFPAKGHHNDVFIMEVPNGKAYVDRHGYVHINNRFIKETQIKHLNFFNGQEYIDQNDCHNVKVVSGRVAIVTHLYPYCYGLWIFDVLSQLALLEIHNVEYDYLLIPYGAPHLQETLDIWGIDRSKIIPLYLDVEIQADMIIKPTSVSNDDVSVVCTNYYIDFLLDHVRNKMLKGLESRNVGCDFPEKIFISRNDAGGRRAIPNEDDVFALFEPLGFRRYELTSLSMAEKILLFHNAKKIVSFIGSGSTNILFCKPGTHYIEIMQKMVEATFFYIADSFQLKYDVIDDSTYYDLVNGSPWAPSAPVSLDTVRAFLSDHPGL